MKIISSPKKVLHSVIEIVPAEMRRQTYSKINFCRKYSSLNLAKPHFKTSNLVIECDIFFGLGIKSIISQYTNVINII